MVPENLSQAEQISVKFIANLNLIKEAKSDLTWWMSLDRKVPMQYPVLPQTPSMAKESDASNKGWGARQGKLSTGERWSLEESRYHIELLAAFLALQSFLQAQQQSDNSNINGQCHSTDRYQQDRRHTIPNTVPAGTDNVAMES